LHDSLGQDLLVIKNWIAYGLSTLDKDNPARETLEEISAATAHAVEGCREIAYNLRPHQMDYIGLTEALRAMLKRIGQASGLRIEARLDDLTGALPKEAEINLFRIVQESLNNIVKHAHATEVLVAVRRDFSADNGQPSRVVVEIRDNGRGFDSATLAQAQRGMGLSGITERAQMLGGAAVIDAAPGRGATVVVTLPVASTAEIFPHE
jgi:signal transduction histidine kinase